MQATLSATYIFYWVLAGGSILFTLYLLVKMCTSGVGGRPAPIKSRPSEEDLQVTQGTYGYDVSYTPGNRASSAGPLPIGGRVDRPPTRSFGSYTTPEREEDE
ncbi:MAG: hypothetical protein ACTSV3_03150 [Candidatus Thorarchaeota archaeon]|nr:MAG: hypothetical protein DRP09_08485 [Candidatus Thorarchaeota archaeon]